MWVFLALLAADIIAGKPEHKESLRAPVENQLLMLDARTEETDEIRKVKKQRIGVWCGAAILCLLCGGMAGRFLLDLSLIHIFRLLTYGSTRAILREVDRRLGDVRPRPKNF